MIGAGFTQQTTATGAPAVSREVFWCDFLDQWAHVAGRDLCEDCWRINSNDEIEEVPC